MNLLTQALRGERKRRTPYEVLVGNYDVFMSKRPPISADLNEVMHHIYRALTDDIENIYPERVFMNEESETIRGKLVVGTNKPWHTKINLELLQDLRAIRWGEASKEMAKIVANELIQEHKEATALSTKWAQNFYGHNGWITCPYVAVYPTYAVDPLTVMKYIELRTVYGFIPRT